MRFGVSLANIAGSEFPIERCLDVARRAEALGYDSVWLNDHVALPAGADAGADEATAPYEPLMLVSALAASTRRIRIGAVLALPFRHPAIPAKMLATADLLSEGRIVLGVGTGRVREEFDALSLPAGYFDRREDVTDEYLRAIKEMWLNTGPSNFAGEFLSFSDVGTFPKPSQRPHPPIVVAGDGESAIVRASRLGNGYLVRAMQPDELAAVAGQLREICRKDRRDPAEVEVHMLAEVSLEARPGPDASPLSGPVSKVWDELRAFGQAGLDHLIMIPAGDPDAATATMERFAAEILPAFGAGRISGQR